VLDNLFAQPVSKSTLVYRLVWGPPPHTPYISSPSQCLLFATHAHIAACFAVVHRLFLVCLSTLYLELHLLSKSVKEFLHFEDKGTCLFYVYMNDVPFQWFDTVGWVTGSASVL